MLIKCHLKLQLAQEHWSHQLLTNLMNCHCFRLHHRTQSSAQRKDVFRLNSHNLSFVVFFFPTAHPRSVSCVKGFLRSYNQTSISPPHFFTVAACLFFPLSFSHSLCSLSCFFPCPPTHLIFPLPRLASF